MTQNGNEKPLLLVVDDTPETLIIIDELLSDDYSIKVATSGMKAIELARDSETPDLILLDVMMPELNGFDTCRLLKADKNTRSIPIVFLTANNDSESEEQGLEVGGSDFISKPIKPAILKLRIKNILKMISLQKRIASYARMQQNKVKQLSENSDSGSTLKEQVSFLEEQLITYKNAYERFIERHRS